MLINLFKPKIKRLVTWTKKELARLGYYSRPAFIIIGAQKSGTSALHSMLRQHPQIMVPGEKELHFFDDGLIRYGDFSTYHSSFPLPFQLSPNKITGEASPSYLYHPDCPKRIYNYSPGMLLVAVLREPVSRAYSGWNMYKKFTSSLSPELKKLAEYRGFEEAIADELKEVEMAAFVNNLKGYVKRGIYVEQLQRYFRFFPRENLLIIGYQDLLDNPAASLASLCRFLRVDDQFKFNVEHKNISKYEAVIPKKAAEMLRAFYVPYNEALFSLLGKEFKW